MRYPLIINRRPKNRLASTTAILLITLVFLAGTAAFLKRQDLRDLIWRRQQGPVPPALTLEEVRARQAAAVVAPETPAPEPAEPLPAAPVSDSLIAPTSAPEPAEPEPDEASVSPAHRPADALPTEMNLLVPMVYQAPFAVWDAVHDDACEEAAILMIQAYMNGESELTREEMDRRILGVVDHEMEVLGYFESTDAATTADIRREYLGLASVKILPVNSIDDVKAQIAAGRPVVLPASGKALRNPNFRGGGPVYHMLVAKGFKPGQIITNEPGTRLGADYLYDEQLLFDAIHDWNDGDTPNGAKVMIVVE